MIRFKDIQGQDNAVRYLERAVFLKRISNSYLFSGPEGVGRAMTAKAFLNALFGESVYGDVSKGHPDVFWITPEKNRKIKIEEIRTAKERLNLKPYGSQYNALVIEDAHMMTIEASNALLKVLEDLPGESIIILISAKKELLLPTVISRCSDIRFYPLPYDKAKKIVLEKTGADEETAEFLVLFSEGSPGRAIKILEEGIIERKNNIHTLLKEISEEDNSICLNWDNEDRDLLMEDIELLIMFFRDVAVGVETEDRFIIDKGLKGLEIFSYYAGYGIERINGILEKLINLKRALAGNVNPKLVAQVLPANLK